MRRVIGKMGMRRVIGEKGGRITRKEPMESYKEEAVLTLPLESLSKKEANQIAKKLIKAEVAKIKSVNCEPGKVTIDVEIKIKTDVEKYKKMKASFTTMHKFLVGRVFDKRLHLKKEKFKYSGDYQRDMKSLYDELKKEEKYFKPDAPTNFTVSFYTEGERAKGLSVVAKYGSVTGKPPLKPGTGYSLIISRTQLLALKDAGIRFFPAYDKCFANRSK